ncbi:hypothetical protein CRUP_013540 [Coryphaenoides rupestris]|nr:hypothetical protein CRUP_013540 [Coryphaenoides rupestris]
MASEEMTAQSYCPVEPHKASGKRSMEDADVTEQPPLKRQLLAEFDRAVDHGDRAGSLLPSRSNPLGVLRDRRVFNYKVSLEPHGWAELHPSEDSPPRPHDGSGASSPPSPPGPAPPRAVVFVPPFLKRRRVDSPQSGPDPQDSPRTRTPAVFIPPFKKRPQPSPPASAPEIPAPPPPPSPTAAETSPYVPPAAVATKSPAAVTESHGRHGVETNGVPEESTAAAGDLATENHEVDQDQAAPDQDQADPEDPQDPEALQDLRLARDVQDMRLRKRRRQAVKPLPGGLLLAKTSGVARVPLRSAGNGLPPGRYSPQQFFRWGAGLGERGGVQLADGGWLVPRDDWTVGKEEFYRALCDTPGVDGRLLSPEWAYNHYRWLVWKLACMERAFPASMASLWLNPEQILLQLKYRGGPPPAVVWLTDGWYPIRAQLDAPLTALLHRGRLAPGGKMVVTGAELVGPQDGCSPLEAPEGLMLKLNGNSCRRARWDARLGFHRDPRPFVLPLASLLSAGGPVGCVDLLILRNYPVLWMEKRSDGGFVFRGQRAEEREARRFHDNNNRTMEALYAEIQARMEAEDKGKEQSGRKRRRTLRQQDLEKLRDGEELHEAVENDPAYLEQLQVLQGYRRSLLERRQTALQERCRRALEQAQEGQGGCPRRDVAPVWKLCVADGRAPPGGPVYMLNLWRPSADLQARLKEGTHHRVYNLAVAAGNRRSPGVSVQLTATSKTHFQEVQVGQDWLSDHFQARRAVHFQDLQDPELQSPCGEVDLELLRPAALLALSNLQLGARRATPLPVLYGGDLTSFSSNPREAHLQSALARLRKQTRADEGFLQRAQERLSCGSRGEDPALTRSPWPDRTRTPAGPKPSPAVCVTPQQRTKPPPSSSSSSSSSTVQTSTPPPPGAPPPPPPSDPKSLRRRRALDFLSRMPSPPPLGPLGSLTSPACINKTFNPPRRSSTPRPAVATTTTATTTTTPARRTMGPRMMMMMKEEEEEEWGNDEGLAMIDTQALHGGGGGVAS